MAHLANPKGAVLVTDALSAMGLAPGQYQLGAQSITITDRAVVTGIVKASYLTADAWRS